MNLDFKNLPSIEVMFDHIDDFSLHYNIKSHEWSHEDYEEATHFFNLVLKKLGIHSNYKKIHRNKKQRSKLINAASTFLFCSLYQFIQYNEPEDSEVTELILSLDNDFEGVLDEFIGDYEMEWYDLIWEVISNVLVMLDINLDDHVTGTSFRDYNHDWLKIADDIKQHKIFHTK